MRWASRKWDSSTHFNINDLMVDGAATTTAQSARACLNCVKRRASAFDARSNVNVNSGRCMMSAKRVRNTDCANGNNGAGTQQTNNDDGDANNNANSGEITVVLPFHNHNVFSFLKQTLIKTKTLNHFTCSHYQLMTQWFIVSKSIGKFSHQLDLDFVCY